MHRLLQYPFDSQQILAKRRKIKREFLNSDEAFVDKRIAILGGSTTADIRQMLELFLLSYGIRPEFYESEYAQYWQDAMFGVKELKDFSPDVIFIHTSNKNILQYPPPHTGQ